MKNKTIVVFLFSAIFILSSFSAQAYDPYDPGSILNPLQVQIVPDSNLQYQQTVNNLENQYQQTLRDQQLKMYEQTQENYQNQLLQQQRDLQTQLLQQQRDSLLPSHNVVYPSQPSCQSGYIEKQVGFATDCVTYDTWCNIDYANSAFQKFQANGKDFICDCKAGYQWNSGRTACVVNTETFPPGCISSIGYSVTSGISCDGTNKCSADSQLNSDRTRCVPTPKTETKVMTPIIKKVPEIKADITNTPNLTPTNSDTKVVTSTEPVKPKSFWTRFLGWLGF